MRLPVLSVQLASALPGRVPLVMPRWSVFDRRLRLVLAKIPARRGVASRRWAMSSATYVSRVSDDFSPMR